MRKPTLDYDRIIRAYGAVLEATSSESVTNEKVLPVPKQDLRAIVIAAILQSKNMAESEALKVALLSLAKFQPLESEEQRAVDAWDQAMRSASAGLSPESLQLLAGSGEIYQAIRTRVASEHEELAALLSLRAA